MSNYILRLVILGGILIVSPYAFAASVEQRVESATRQSDVLTDSDQYQKKLRNIPKKPPEIKQKEEIPSPTEERFYVEKIRLEGCVSFPAEDFASIVAKFEKREITLTELNNLAKEIEGEYLRRGIISAVYVPPQDIREKSVVLQVIEAKMGELMIQPAKYFSNKRLYYYWKVYSGEILRYDLVSKSIQIMNKNPDREVRAALTAGKKPQTTDVILVPKTNFPVHFTSSFDREGSPLTGRGRLGLGFRHNNFLGLDDSLLAGYTFGRDFWGRYAYHSIPISSQGTSLIYGYSTSKSIPKKEFSAYGIVSASQDYSVSVHQDIFKKDEYIGEVYAGFNAKDKTTELNTGTLTRDRLRIFSLGGTYIKRDLGSTFSITPEIYQGVFAFGASGKHNPLASRGAIPRYTRFNLTTNYKKALPLNTQLSLRFKNQFSSSKLTPQEEFSIGGIDSVRGYPSGDYLADNAFVSNSELLLPSIYVPKNWRFPYSVESLRDQTTTVLFVDYGWGKRRGALADEQKQVKDIGVGAGLRFSLFSQALLRLEWGFPIGDATITEEGHSRFHFSVDFQEKLPEELERMKKFREEEFTKKVAWEIIDEELNRQDSVLRYRMNNYLEQARQAYEQGNLEYAKELYERIDRTGKSLYQQAEEYVTSLFQKENSSIENERLAKVKYREGKLVEAKQLWQKIYEESRPVPLILEF